MILSDNVVEIGHLESSRDAAEECLRLTPNCYEGWKLLLATLTERGAKEAMMKAMARLLRVDPHDPMIFDECIACTRGTVVSSLDFIGLLEALRTNSPEDTLIEANWDFYTARVLIGIDRFSARQHLAAA